MKRLIGAFLEHYGWAQNWTVLCPIWAFPLRYDPILIPNWDRYGTIARTGLFEIRLSMAILLEEIRVMKAVRFFDKEKPTSAAKYGFNRSKLRIGGQIATGNLSSCPLDGDFAPHTRIIASLMRLVHCVHSKALGALREEL